MLEFKGIMTVFQVLTVQRAYKCLSGGYRLWLWSWYRYWLGGDFECHCDIDIDCVGFCKCRCWCSFVHIQLPFLSAASLERVGVYCVYIVYIVQLYCIYIVYILCIYCVLLTFSFSQLLHWNGSLAAMRERQCSRQEVDKVFFISYLLLLSAAGRRWLGFLSFSFNVFIFYFGLGFCLYLSFINVFQRIRS